MGKLTTRMVRKVRKAAEDTYKKVETRILVAEGRKAIRAKKKAAVRVTRKAARAGLVTGAAAAVAVIVHEIRKRAD